MEPSDLLSQALNVKYALPMATETNANMNAFSLNGHVISGRNLKENREFKRIRSSLLKKLEKAVTTLTSITMSQRDYSDPKFYHLRSSNFHNLMQLLLKERQKGIQIILSLIPIVTNINTIETFMFAKSTVPTQLKLVMKYVRELIPRPDNGNVIRYYRYSKDIDAIVKSYETIEQEIIDEFSNSILNRRTGGRRKTTRKQKQNRRL
jgi:hypothetical protein